MGCRVLVLAAALALAGCARVSQPEPQQLSTGFPLSGQISRTASGQMQVSFSDGLGFSCLGPFKRQADKTKVTSPIMCADGRGGVAVTELASGGKPKVAVLRFPGGREERAVFKPSVSFQGGPTPR